MARFFIPGVVSGVEGDVNWAYLPVVNADDEDVAFVVLLGVYPLGRILAKLLGIAIARVCIGVARYMVAALVLLGSVFPSCSALLDLLLAVRQGSNFAFSCR